MKTATINKKRLSYYEKGEGFPVLFGHSYLWNAQMWEPQIEVLSKYYRCIVPELWAHGGSANPDAYPYTIEALAQDYWQFTRALGLESFAIVGLSVGGMWAAQLALDHPEFVKALVIMDSFVGPEPEAIRNYYFSLMDAIEKAGAVPAPIKEAITPFFLSLDTLKNNITLVQYFHQVLDSYTPEQIKGVISLGKGIFSRPCLLDRLPEISLPTLIMVGSEDKPRPPHESHQMANLIPNAQLDIIPGAGHISNLEQSGYVNTKLLGFLKDILSKTDGYAQLAAV